jgi:hypothetical protein
MAVAGPQDYAMVARMIASAGNGSELAERQKWLSEKRAQGPIEEISLALPKALKKRVEKLAKLRGIYADDLIAGWIESGLTQEKAKRKG